MSHELDRRADGAAVVAVMLSLYRTGVRADGTRCCGWSHLRTDPPAPGASARRVDGVVVFAHE